MTKPYTSPVNARNDEAMKLLIADWLQRRMLAMQQYEEALLSMPHVYTTSYGEQSLKECRERIRCIQWLLHFVRPTNPDQPNQYTVQHGEAPDTDSGPHCGDCSKSTANDC